MLPKEPSCTGHVEPLEVLGTLATQRPVQAHVTLAIWRSWLFWLYTGLYKIK